MSSTARPYIAALLALLFILSGPASAMVTTTTPGSAVCGEAMASGSAHLGQKLLGVNHCHDPVSKVCPGSGGIGQCVVMLALTVCPDLTIANMGAQPVHMLPNPDYQNPFPKTVTPPPEHRS